ncbi:hypothetical protein COOONC_23120 [Cooperia oncophora]
MIDDSGIINQAERVYTHQIRVPLGTNADKPRELTSISVSFTVVSLIRKGAGLNRMTHGPVGAFCPSRQQNPVLVAQVAGSSYDASIDREKVTQYGDSTARKRGIVPEVRRRLSRSCGHVNEIPVNSKSHHFRKRTKKRELFRTGALPVDFPAEGAQ